MRLATVRLDGAETAAVALENGAVPVIEINDALGAEWPTDLLPLIAGDHLGDLGRWWDALSEGDLEEISQLAIPASEVEYVPSSVQDLGHRPQLRRGPRRGLARGGAG